MKFIERFFWPKRQIAPSDGSLLQQKQRINFTKRDTKLHNSYESFIEVSDVNNTEEFATAMNKALNPLGKYVLVVGNTTSREHSSILDEHEYLYSVFMRGEEIKIQIKDAKNMYKDVIFIQRIQPEMQGGRRKAQMYPDRDTPDSTESGTGGSGGTHTPPSVHEDIPFLLPNEVPHPE
jgi:hypothetical protein